MAVKTNLRLLMSLMFLTFVSVESSSNNSLTECKCDVNLRSCYPWVTTNSCDIMDGKFKFDPNCNCCPICVIKKDLFESCYQSIPGFKVKCRKGLFCSKKYGLLCIDLRRKLLEETLITFDKMYDNPKNPRNPYEDRLLLSVPEHQRPLKRIPRTQHKKKNKKIKSDTDTSFEKLGKGQTVVEII